MTKGAKLDECGAEWRVMTQSLLELLEPCALSFSPIRADRESSSLVRERDRGCGNAHSRANARKCCELSWKICASESVSLLTGG